MTSVQVTEHEFCIIHSLPLFHSLQNSYFVVLLFGVFLEKELKNFTDAKKKDPHERAEEN